MLLPSLKTADRNIQSASKSEIPPIVDIPSPPVYRRLFESPLSHWIRIFAFFFFLPLEFASIFRFWCASRSACVRLGPWRKRLLFEDTVESSKRAARIWLSPSLLFDGLLLWSYIIRVHLLRYLSKSVNCLLYAAAVVEFKSFLHLRWFLRFCCCWVLLLLLLS